jgi:hypothetical protein
MALGSENKTCNRCGESKPLDRFVKNKNSTGGYEHRCKDCRAKEDKARRSEWLREYEREYRKEYRKNKGVKEKDSARNKVTMAIRKGRVVRPDTCSLCGKTCKPQAHHHDYNKPFDVIWLCRLCHEAEHRKG